MQYAMTRVASASTTADRLGFQQLAAHVALGEIA